MGGSETVLGQVLGDRRKDIVLATKYSKPMSSDGTKQGASRRYILSAVEASLTRLKTDYIDLYQQHDYDPLTPMEETLRALDDLVRQGKVRYIGCSNFLTYQLVRAIGRSEVLRITRFATVQPRYNLLFRQIEREMLPFCLEDGVGVIPYNPIAGGLLSGKHKRGGEPAEGGRFALGNAAQAYQDRYWHDREFATVEQIGALAGEAGIEMVSLSVAWVLANPAVTAPIVGASRPEQLDASLAALETPLDPELKSRLDELTHEYRMGDAPR
jgi:aryl-alcohol dehydrogenase (NADP+)